MLSLVFRDLLLFIVALAGLALPIWPWLKSAQGAERLALCCLGWHSQIVNYSGGLGFHGGSGRVERDRAFLRAPKVAPAA